jgi:hypothetical protein
LKAQVLAWAEQSSARLLDLDSTDVRAAGLLERLRARDAGGVEPAAPYDSRRDAATGSTGPRKSSTC